MNIETIIDDLLHDTSDEKDKIELVANIPHWVNPSDFARKLYSMAYIKVKNHPVASVLTAHQRTIIIHALMKVWHKAMTETKEANK